jgi:hypothetical protein
VDEVPSHEGIQDDVDAAPFRESDVTLVETTNYLVKLDKYAPLGGQVTDSLRRDQRRRR